MLWTAKTVTFYFDGIEVLSGPTPSTWTSPMAMLVNLAVGGWGGTPNAAQFPAQMQVDYIHADALADGSTQVVNGPPSAPVDTMGDNGATSGQTARPVISRPAAGPSRPPISRSRRPTRRPCRLARR